MTKFVLSFSGYWCGSAMASARLWQTPKRPSWTRAACFSLPHHAKICRCLFARCIASSTRLPLEKVILRVGGVGETLQVQQQQISHSSTYFAEKRYRHNGARRSVALDKKKIPPLVDSAGLACTCGVEYIPKISLHSEK